MTILRRARSTGESVKESKRPAIIRWQDQKILRTHALKPTVLEIIETSKSLDVVKIGLIGEPHTGKGTMAETLAHMIHTLSVERGYVPWAFRRYGKDEFYNLSETR